MAKKKKKAKARGSELKRADDRGRGRLGSARAAAVWLFAFSALLGLHLTCVSSELGGNLGGDNAVYFLLSRALSEGKGYVDLYLPGEPAHVKYPPLFPLLLAPFHLLFRNPLPWMHGLVAFMNAGAALLLGMLAARRWKSLASGVAFALVAGTIPQVYKASLHLLTEPAFMAFSYLALLLVHEEKEKTCSRPRALLIVVSGLAAYFTRSAGIALLLVLVFDFFWKKTRVQWGSREVPLALPAAAFFFLAALAWWLRCRFAGGGGLSYLGEFLLKDPYHVEFGRVGLVELWDRVEGHALLYLPYLGRAAFTPSWMPGFPPFVSNLLGLVLFLLVSAGVFIELRSGKLAAELFFIFSLLMVIAWPFLEERFLLPLIPLCSFYLFRFMERAGSFLGKTRAPRAGAAALWVMMALALSGQAIALTPQVKGRFLDLRDPKRPVIVKGFGEWKEPVINWANYDLDALVNTPGLMTRYRNWLIINRVTGLVAEKDAVILSRKPMLTYLLSGRKSAPLLMDPRPEKQWEYMKARRVSYLITGMDESPLAEAWKEHPERFKPVAVIEETNSGLFRVMW